MGLAAAAALALVLHVVFGGSVRYGIDEVIRNIFAGSLQGDDTVNRVIWQLRLPRACAAVLVGGILGGVGAVFQSLFRNPLAEPYIVGVSSGAALGGALAIVIGVSGALFGLGMVGLSFVGGLLALWIVLSIARVKGAIEIHTLLISGVLVGAMLHAGLTLVLLMNGRDTNMVLRWLLGSTTPMYWPNVVVLAVALGAGLPILWRQTWALNAFAMGETTAQRLGVEVGRLKMLILVVGTAMTAAAVGTVGIIPFLGLIAPHMARKLVGVDLRRSFIASTLIGMILLVFSDLVAQRLSEMPVGAVTAILGAPMLMILLRRTPSTV
jgi:iron complex transport system permease protein